MNQLSNAKTEQGKKLALIQQNIEQAGDAIERAMAVARGLKFCRDMVASQLAVFKELAGSQMGFAVDRPDRTTDQQYIEAISQALLEGASITGNHFGPILSSAARMGGSMGTHSGHCARRASGNDRGDYRARIQRQKQGNAGNRAG